MSQRLVLELLKELGGKATSRQIKVLAKKRYPDSALDVLVGDRLSKLIKAGMVIRRDGQVVEGKKVSLFCMVVSTLSDDINPADLDMVFQCATCDHKSFQTYGGYQRHIANKH